MQPFGRNGYRPKIWDCAPVSRTQASNAMTSRLPRYEPKCVQRSCASNAGLSLCVHISRERSYPLPIIWHHSKGNWLRYNFAADSFFIMKLCSRLFVLYCRNCPKDDKFRYFIPILRKLGRRRTLVDGSLESPCRVLVKCNWLNFVFYLLRLRRYKAKRIKTRCYQEGVDHLEPRFQGEGVVPKEYFLVSTKLDTFCYPTVQTTPFYVPSFWHNTGVWQTDGQTESLLGAQVKVLLLYALPFLEQRYYFNRTHFSEYLLCGRQQISDNKRSERELNHWICYTAEKL